MHFNKDTFLEIYKKTNIQTNNFVIFKRKITEINNTYDKKVVNVSYDLKN